METNCSWTEDVCREIRFREYERCNIFGLFWYNVSHFPQVLWKKRALEIFFCCGPKQINLDYEIYWTQCLLINVIEADKEAKYIKCIWLAGMICLSGLSVTFSQKRVVDTENKLGFVSHLAYWNLGNNAWQSNLIIKYDENILSSKN